MSVLLTGGAGFIGSHTAVAMIEAGYDVIIADDLSNSSPKVIERIETITGTRPAFYQIDVADAAALEPVFRDHKIDGVIHFAGFKSVPESTRLPLKYYRNNLDTALTTLEVMEKYGCNAFVFSSSATVYGETSCGISIPSAPIPPASSARRPTEFPTTSCPISPRWRSVSGIACLSTEATIPRRTVPASGIISMWWILQRAMSKPSVMP